MANPAYLKVDEGLMVLRIYPHFEIIIDEDTISQRLLFLNQILKLILFCIRKSSPRTGG